MPVEVQVLSSALVGKGLRANRSKSFSFSPVGFWGNDGGEVFRTLKTRRSARWQPMRLLEKRNETYRVVLMQGGKRHGLSLGTGGRREAESFAGGVEKVVLRLEQKLLKLSLAWTSSLWLTTTGVFGFLVSFRSRASQENLLPNGYIVKGVIFRVELDLFEPM